MDNDTNKREIKAPTGTELSCRSWLTEAPLRMLMNNLDSDVAERPEDLVVYGGIGRAARNWECYDRIVHSLRNLKLDQTLLVQSGKPVGVSPIRTRLRTGRVAGFAKPGFKEIIRFRAFTVGVWTYKNS